MVLLLERLERGEILSPAASKEMIEILKRSEAERFSFDGECFQVPEMTVRPQALHRGSLFDDMKCAFNTPQSMKIAAQLGLGQMFVTAVSLAAAGFAVSQGRTALVDAPVLARKTPPVLVEGRIAEIESKTTGFRVVLDDTFNKSVCLDLETYLIRALNADRTFTVLNKQSSARNSGRRCRRVRPASSSANRQRQASLWAGLWLSCRAVTCRVSLGRMAKARAGKPKPFFTLGQVTTITAPVAGTLDGFVLIVTVSAAAAPMLNVSVFVVAEVVSFVPPLVEDELPALPEKARTSATPEESPE